MPEILPCIKPIGPLNAKIVSVGEAPGEQEELTGIPFIGQSGQEYDRMLEEAGLRRRDLYLTNVFLTRPPNNKLDHFLVGSKDGAGCKELGPVRTGKYLHKAMLPEIHRLHSELKTVKPNLIIATGATALWAIIGSGGISKVRGTVLQSRFGKVLPTFHPATVLYDLSNRPLIISDLRKAAFEQDFPDIRRPKRSIIIEPTLEEVTSTLCLIRSSVPITSCDIETWKKSISIIGFAWAKDKAIVIPFLHPGGRYWTRNEEIIVRKEINLTLCCETLSKLFHNGMFDMQYLLYEGYSIRGEVHDSMILHHAMFPELQKSLGFLGSIYTNETGWKAMRVRGEEALKKED